MSPVESLTDKSDRIHHMSNKSKIKSIIVLILVASAGLIALSSVLGAPPYFDTPQNNSVGNDDTATVEKPSSTASPDIETIVSETPGRTTGAIPTSVQTPTPTHTPTPKSTVTPIRTPRSTPTDTHSATTTISNEPYAEFVATVFGEAEVDADVPVHIRGWSMEKDEVLFVVVNLTTRSEDDIQRANEVNTLVTSGFAQAVAYHDTGNIGGSVPKKLRIAEVNNTKMPPKTISVNTSLTREYYTGQITGPEFNNRYWNNIQNQTSKQRRFTKRLDRSAGNVTLFNESAE